MLKDAVENASVAKHFAWFRNAIKHDGPVPHVYFSFPSANFESPPSNAP